MKVAVTHAVLYELSSAVLFPHLGCHWHAQHRCRRASKWVMPGDNVTVDVELQKTVAMEKGLKFAIREGGRTIGSGIVTEVIA